MRICFARRILLFVGLMVATLCIAPWEGLTQQPDTPFLSLFVAPDAIDTRPVGQKPFPGVKDSDVFYFVGEPVSIMGGLWNRHSQAVVVGPSGFHWLNDLKCSVHRKEGDKWVEVSARPQHQRWVTPKQSSGGKDALITLQPNTYLQAQFHIVLESGKPLPPGNYRLRFTMDVPTLQAKTVRTQTSAIYFAVLPEPVTQEEKLEYLGHMATRAMEAGEYEKCRRLWEEWEKLSGRKPYFALGMLAQFMGKYSEAIEHYNAAIESIRNGQGTAAKKSPAEREASIQSIRLMIQKCEEDAKKK